jgi:hypothetical protein
MKTRTILKAHSSLTTAFVATVLLGGCASGGGSGARNGPAQDPAYMPLRAGYEPTRCGTLNGYPVPCVSRFPDFGEGSGVRGTPAPIPAFTSWADSRESQAPALDVSLTFVKQHVYDPIVLSIDEPVFGGGNSASHTSTRYDHQGNLEEWIAAKGGGAHFYKYSELVASLAAIGQPGIDYADIRSGTGPQSSFTSRDSHGSTLAANPYALEWNYQSFGVWNRQSWETGNIGASSFGSPTPASAVPLNGTASFIGKLAGFYVSPAGLGSVAAADVKVGADFGTRTLSLASSNTRLTRDLAAATAAPTLNLSGTLTYGPASNAFSGALTNAGATMTGASKGQFYGPTAQELGGVFIVKSPTTVETFVGAYGAKR